MLSKGPERYKVPKVTGMSRQTATEAIRRTNLVLGPVTEAYNERVRAGVVISQNPKLNTSVKRDQPVGLVVSKGKKPIAVRDQTGERRPTAVRALERLGFAVTVTTTTSETVPEGLVISQTPRNGNRFAKDTIKLVVSEGPALRQVPNVWRKQLDEATQLLKAAGFEVKVERAPFHVGLNMVAGQSPGGGKLAKPGTTVVVTIV